MTYETELTARNTRDTIKDRATAIRVLASFPEVRLHETAEYLHEDILQAREILDLDPIDPANQSIHDGLEERRAEIVQEAEIVRHGTRVTGQDWETNYIEIVLDLSPRVAIEVTRAGATVVAGPDRCTMIVPHEDVTLLYGITL